MSEVAIDTRPPTPRDIQSAAEWVHREFPVKGYVVPWSVEYTYPWLARLFLKHVSAGAEVLDFGSGPGDIAAVLAQLGYRCVAADDLQDPWHLRDGNQQKILEFNQRAGVQFQVLSRAQPWPWPLPAFDAVLMHHVLEHIHDSPRPLLNLLIGALRENGLLVIGVPNAVNLRKRLAVLRGKTNHPPYPHVYWYEGEWRGHTREYVRDDLLQLVRFAGLELVEFGFYHCMAGAISAKLRAIWKLATAICPSGRDSLYVVARKPSGWKPRDRIDPNDPEAAYLAKIGH